MKKQLGKNDYTPEQVAAITSSDQRVLKSKALLLYAYENNLVEEFKKAAEHFDYVLNYGLNPDFDPRAIVGDNYADAKDKNYGNNDVTGPDAEHGTHVAGIVAANRKNELGVKGIADNVKIMALRAVPNGDERDKGNTGIERCMQANTSDRHDPVREATVWHGTLTSAIMERARVTYTQES